MSEDKLTSVTPLSDSLEARKTISRIWAQYDDDNHSYDAVIAACSNRGEMLWPFELTSKHRQTLEAYCEIKTVKAEPFKQNQKIEGDPDQQMSNAESIKQAIEQLAQNTGITRDKLREFLNEHVEDMNEMAKRLEHKLEERIASLKGAKRIEIVDPKGAKLFTGLAHRQFETLCRVAQARNHDGNRMNFWITGPAGTGKTTAGKMLCNALFKDGLNEKGEPAFMAQGTSDQKYDMTGFRDASGEVRVTEFRRVYRDGGVILIDEVDGWMPNALLAINAATANPYGIFPDGIVERHKDTIILCAANTYGYGEVTEYVGRMKQDAAFLDRFLFLDWPIDEELEAELGSEFPDWVQYVQAVRGRAASRGYKILITPRATMYGASLLRQGIEQDIVVNMAIKKGMAPDMWDAIK